MNTTDKNLNFIYPQTSATGKLRSSTMWLLVVKIAVPFFIFFWKYGINLNRKIASIFFNEALQSFYKKDNLRNDGIAIVSNFDPYTNFAKALRGKISDSVLKNAKKTLLENPNPEAFFLSLHNEVDEDTKFKILEFALSQAALTPVIDYFGVVPKLNSISILYNISKIGEGQVGSKEWHRDDSQFKALNIFMCLSEVNDESGAYYAIPQSQIDGHAIVPLEKIDMDQSVWTRYRHSLELIKKYVPNVNPVKLEGPIGTTALVDPGLLYHRGGHCTKNDRIMIQISYTLDTPDPSPSIIDTFKVRNHPRVTELQNTWVKKLLTDGNTEKWFWKLGIQNPVFFVGRKILSYNLNSKA